MSLTKKSYWIKDSGQKYNTYVLQTKCIFFELNQYSLESFFNRIITEFQIDAGILLICLGHLC